jgi:hypothetical protein
MTIQKKYLLTALTMSAAAALPVSQAQAQTACHLSDTANYSLAFNVSGNCRSMSADTAQAFIDALDTNGLRTINPTYSGVEQASINADFNRLGLSMAFPNAGATGAGAQLNFAIPALNENRTFNGGTRDASKDLLEDYLKKSNIIGRIMKHQAANNPNSPITGAGGLVPSMVASDFNLSFTDTATSVAGPAAEARQENAATNLMGVALSYGNYSALNRDTKVATIPLSYTVRNDLDPRRQLVISMPITQIDTAGAKSYQTALGAAYRLPMNDNWTLTPSGRVSVVGSEDLATAAGLYSFGLTSTYIWTFPSFDVAMGNMVSYNQTMKFKAGDYNFDPDIQTTVLRNGVMFSQPVTIGGSKMSIEYSLIDTRYIGDDVYADNTQEIGITLGTNKRAYSSRSFFRAGLSYIQGKDMDGFTVNIGYWF